MPRSNRQANGGSALANAFRSGHRWLGAALAVFLILLAVTGVGINHSDDWQLNNRHIRWAWLLDAYGIHAPPVTASFADRGHRATQMGARLYFDEREILQDLEQLTGMVVLENLAMASGTDTVIVLTLDGKLVEIVDLSDLLPGAVARLGRVNNRLLVASNGQDFIADAALGAFEKDAGHPGLPAAVWSINSEPDARQVTNLRQAWRGRGLSVEQLLLDLHSGRILQRTGKALLDLLAIATVILSLSGLYLWTRRGPRKNARTAGTTREGT